MKSYRQELWFNIPGRRDFVNITPQVETCIQESGIREGLVLVNTKHIKVIQPIPFRVEGEFTASPT